MQAERVPGSRTAASRDARRGTGTRANLAEVTRYVRKISAAKDLAARILYTEGELLARTRNRSVNVVRQLLATMYPTAGVRYLLDEAIRKAEAARQKD